MEFALGVYDALVQEGESLGLRHAGYHALESLRTEKAYRSWGHELSSLDSPLEAGLGFAVAFDKGHDFIGRDALLLGRDITLNRRLAAFTILDSQPLLLGDEPVYRDGTMVGRITSGTFGHTLGRSVGLGYVHSEDGVDSGFIGSGTYEVEIATERYPAEASLRAPYDPSAKRVRI